MNKDVGPETKSQAKVDKNLAMLMNSQENTLEILGLKKILRNIYVLVFAKHANMTKVADSSLASVIMMLVPNDLKGRVSLEEAHEVATEMLSK